MIIYVILLALVGFVVFSEASDTTDGLGKRQIVFGLIGSVISLATLLLLFLIN